MRCIFAPGALIHGINELGVNDPWDQCPEDETPRMKAPGTKDRFIILPYSTQTIRRGIVTEVVNPLTNRNIMGSNPAKAYKNLQHALGILYACV